MLSDAGLVIGANAIAAAITHLQLHSGARGADGTTNVVAGSRIAVGGAVTVDADADITVPSTSWTGLAANQPVTEVSYWNAATGGTYVGGGTLTGDQAANAAGEYTVGSITENGSAIS